MLVFLLLLLVVFIMVNSRMVEMDVQTKQLANLMLVLLLIFCLLYAVPGPYWGRSP